MILRSKRLLFAFFIIHGFKCLSFELPFPFHILSSAVHSIHPLLFLTSTLLFFTIDPHIFTLSESHYSLLFAPL